MFVLRYLKAFQLTNQYFCIIRRTFILLSLFCEQTWSKYWTKYWQVYLVSQSNSSSVLQLRNFMILCAHVTILNYVMLCKLSFEIYFWWNIESISNVYLVYLTIFFSLAFPKQVRTDSLKFKNFYYM